MRAIIFAVAIFAVSPAWAGNANDFSCKSGGQAVRVHAVMGDYTGDRGYLQIGKKKSALTDHGTGGTGTGLLIYKSPISQSPYNLVLIDDTGVHFRYKNRSVHCSG